MSRFGSPGNLLPGHFYPHGDLLMALRQELKLKSPFSGFSRAETVAGEALGFFTGGCPPE